MIAAFFILALAALAAAVLVVASRNIVHGALWLIVCFLALAGIFLVLGAEFVAAVQVMIYAGSVVVLFVFVVLTVGSRPAAARMASPGWRLTAAALGLTILGELLAGTLRLQPAAGPGGGHDLSPVQVMAQAARLLFNDWLIPLEVFSFVVLAAMVGIGILRREERGK